MANRPPNFIDLTDNKYGKLTVVSYHGFDKRRQHVLWNCICECGNKKVICGNHLKSGNTKSCGCIHKEVCRKLGLDNRKDDSFVAFNRLYSNYKNNAKRRGIIFELTKEDAHKLFQQDCYYCGSKPKQVWIHLRGDRSYKYNGIDRVDNTLNYTVDNCVSCCSWCNQAKSDIPLDDFIDWAKRLYENLKRIGKINE